MTQPLRHFPTGPLNFRPISRIRDSGKRATTISWINGIRADYPWSMKAYEDGKVANVYLVCTGQTPVGFIECEARHVDLSSIHPIDLYLHELHIHKDRKRQGIASAILSELLDKGVPIELVVANANVAMIELMKKHSAVPKYQAPNTTTFLLERARTSPHAASCQL